MARALCPRAPSLAADSHLALAALQAMDGGDRAVASRALAALCESYRLPRAAAALNALAAQRDQ
jgi:hypothetical protein